MWRASIPGLIDALVVDEADADDLDGLGEVRPIVTRTLMTDPEARQRLAEAALGAVARMNVAVLGGTGAFGSALARRLVEAGDGRDHRLARSRPGRGDGSGGRRRTRGRERRRRRRRRPRRARGRRIGRTRRPRPSSRTPSARRLSSASPASSASRAAPPSRPTSRCRWPSGCSRCCAAPSWRGSTPSRRPRCAAGKAEGDALVCGDDDDAKAAALELAATLVTGRALDAGPLASARALEGMTAVIVNLNRRYRGHAGLRSRRAVTDLTISPVRGLPELREGDDLARLIAERAELQDGDILVVAQKAISKIEGRIVRLDDVEPSARARGARRRDGDARRIEVILREAKRIVRTRGSLLITETRHGFVCASSGVDASNAPEPGTLVLLPVDPDASADRLRSRAARADRPRRRRRRQRLLRPPVAPGDDRRRDRRRGRRSAARPEGRARSERLRAELDRHRDRRRDRRRGAARDGQARPSTGRDRSRARRRGDGRARDLVMPAERNLFS